MTWKSRGDVRAAEPAENQPMPFDDLVYELDQRWPNKIAKITIEGSLVYAHDLRGRRKLVAVTAGLSLPWPHSNVYNMNLRSFTHFQPRHVPGWYTSQEIENG